MIGGFWPKLPVRAVTSGSIERARLSPCPAWIAASGCDVGSQYARWRVSGASAPSRSVLDGSRWFGGPGPGQQFAEAAVWPVIDELGEHVSQVGMRIDAMQFAGLDQRGEHGPVGTVARLGVRRRSGISALVL